MQTVLMTDKTNTQFQQEEEHDSHSQVDSPSLFLSPPFGLIRIRSLSLSSISVVIEGLRDMGDSSLGTYRWRKMKRTTTYDVSLSFLTGCVYMFG